MSNEWSQCLPELISQYYLSFFSSVWRGRAILVQRYLNPSVLFRCRKDLWLVQPSFTYTTEWQSTWYIHFQVCIFNSSPTTPASCPFIPWMQLSNSWILNWCSPSKLRYLNARTWLNLSSFVIMLSLSQRLCLPPQELYKLYKIFILSLCLSSDMLW